MNSRERLRRCYFHEQLDRPGVFIRTGYPRQDPTYDRLKAYVNAQTDLKLSWASSLLESQDYVEHRFEPHSEDWKRRVATMHTPAGDLQGTRLVSLKGLPGLNETYFLKSREDAKKYLSLPPATFSGDAAEFFQMVADVGDRGIVDVFLGHNPAATVANLFGSEMFAIFSKTDRDILHELCERQMTNMLGRLKYVLSLGVGPYFAIAGEEFIVPPLHGPEDFYDFNVKYDKPIIDLIHEAGGRIHVHCHGSIKKVFTGFVDMGVDVLHPLEAPPMGDVTAAEAKRLACGKMTLEGNIQIAAMYEHTPDQIRRETQALIRDAFDDRRGLIVCPTASPYQRGDGEKCLEQFKAMIDTVLNFTG